jgi:glutamine synthetase
VDEDIYEMTPSERKRRGIAVLPGNLKEALEALAEDELLREGLGRNLLDKYLEIKRREWREFSTVVHEWERKRYLDV